MAFVPEGVDDTALEHVTAYDADGNAVLLDAQVSPENPVIVLGLNERTDEDGKLKIGGPVTRNSGTNESVALAAASSYQVRMYLVHLINDKEPWAKGDAEISMKARSRGCSGVEYKDTNWSNLDHDDDWWQGPRILGSTTCDVVFYWWEDDGGSFDFTLKYGGFGLGVQMDDSDDLIGGIQVPHARFAGAGVDTWDKREWSALRQWTD